MKQARFDFLAGQLAPRREAIGVEWKADGHDVLLDCGHSFICNPHFSVAVGSYHRCQQCGRGLVRNTAEFKAEENAQ